MTRRERDERNRRIVAAVRRGVSYEKAGAPEGITRQAVAKIVHAWDDVPSVPADGVVVDSGNEVRQTIAAFDQAIEDLAVIVGSDAQSHVKLGAITRALDARERRLRLMAQAGYISRNLAAPLIEQQMASMVSGIVEVMRRRGVAEDVIRELRDLSRQHVRSPVIDGREVIAA